MTHRTSIGPPPTPSLFTRTSIPRRNSMAKKATQTHYSHAHSDPDNHSCNSEQIEEDLVVCRGGQWDQLLSERNLVEYHCTNCARSSPFIKEKDLFKNGIRYLMCLFSCSLHIEPDRNSLKWIFMTRERI